jgi:hypothetical protein
MISVIPALIRIFAHWTHAVERCLHDRVLLCVDAATQLVVRPGGDPALLAQAADLLAVPKPLGGPVVAGGEHPAVLDDDRAAVAPQTG